MIGTDKKMHHASCGWGRGKTFIHYLESLVLQGDCYISSNIHICPPRPSHHVHQARARNGARKVPTVNQSFLKRAHQAFKLSQDHMALVTMSTFVALPEVKHKHHAGIFEPSTELLDKLRGLLVSSQSKSTATPIQVFPPSYFYQHTC